MDCNEKDIQEKEDKLDKLELELENDEIIQKITEIFRGYEEEVKDKKIVINKERMKDFERAYALAYKTFKVLDVDKVEYKLFDVIKTSGTISIISPYIEPQDKNMFIEILHLCDEVDIDASTSGEVTLSFKFDHLATLI